MATRTLQGPGADPGRDEETTASAEGGAGTLHRTVYCGGLHRAEDGLPVRHSCRVLDPRFLRAELEEDLSGAVTILELMPLVLHPGLAG